MKTESTRRKYPIFIEVKKAIRGEELQAIVFTYDLVFYSCMHDIYLLGQYVKLRPQEYQFLKKIVSQNGKAITAEKLMDKIGAKITSTKYSKQDLANRIKSKIKCKIKNAIDKNGFIPKDKNTGLYVLHNTDYAQWAIIDENYLSNNSHWQFFELKLVLNDLITGEKGKYYSKFRTINFKQ